ncbi:MAG: hypothetical protein HXY22_09965 [Alphaproteobacteria bacterium]|nr:hypothetical protein [Alphaproteobacteria bacterium]
MMAKEKQFSDWIAARKADLEQSATDLGGVQAKQIDAFFAKSGWNDSIVCVQGANADFQHESEFTLKNLKAIIDAIGGALFSSGSSVPGAKTDADAGKKAVQAAVTMGGAAADAATVGLYIAGKVFDILSGVLMSFDASTKLAYTHSYKSESLGYGMTLFCTVAAESYQSQSFFNDEYIFQYLFLYEVRFSVLQAQSEGKQDLVRQYENALAAFETRLNDLDGKVQAGKLSAAEYVDQSKAWNDLIDATQAKLLNLKAKLYRRSA